MAELKSSSSDVGWSVRADVPAPPMFGLGGQLRREVVTAERQTQPPIFAGWQGGSQRPVLERLRSRLVPTILTLLALTVPSIGFTPTSPRLGPFPVHVLVGWAAAFLVAAWFSRQPRIRRKHLMMDDPRDLHACAYVEFSVNDAMKYGSDYGVLQTVDGWLLFEGESTRFQIRLSDVEFRRDWHGNPMRRDEPSLRLLVNGEPFILKLKEIPSHRQHQGVLLPSTVLDMWMRSRGRQEGRSIYPPLTPDPEIIPETKLTLKLAAGAAAFGCGSVALSFLIPPFSRFLISGPVGNVPMLLAWALAFGGLATVVMSQSKLLLFRRLQRQYGSGHD